MTARSGRNAGGMWQAGENKKSPDREAVDPALVVLACVALGIAGLVWFLGREWRKRKATPPAAKR